MVTKFLQQAPYWTAMRCRMVFWESFANLVSIDAVMSGDQPEGADWDIGAGSPFTILIEAPSEQWIESNRAILDRWADEGLGIEVRRTRAWEEGSQVVVWSPDTSLLVTLAS